MKARTRILPVEVNTAQSLVDSQSVGAESSSRIDMHNTSQGPEVLMTTMPEESNPPPERLHEMQRDPGF